MQVKQLPELQGQKRLAVVFGSGEEMIGGLADLTKIRSIAGAYFTGIGALRAAMLGFFDITRREYRRFGIDEQVEVLSLSGNIAHEDGEPRIHAHIVVGRFNGATLGGHLLEAHVRPTLEVILIETPAALRRRFDPATGLALLDLSDPPRSRRGAHLGGVTVALARRWFRKRRKSMTTVAIKFAPMMAAGVMV